MVGKLFYVRLLREKGRGMSEHLLLEVILRVEHGLKGNIIVEVESK